MACSTCLLMFTYALSSDFRPYSGSSSECGADEPHWGQDALHTGMAVLARVWNHPFSCQVSVFLKTQCFCQISWSNVWAPIKTDVRVEGIESSRTCYCNMSFSWFPLLIVKFHQIRFQGGKKDELIGITYNRLIRMDASTGDAIKTWRFSNMKQWNVNWEIKMVRCFLCYTFIPWCHWLLLWTRLHINLFSQVNVNGLIT